LIARALMNRRVSSLSFLTVMAAINASSLEMG
jgi:hypothetical protein